MTSFSTPPLLTPQDPQVELYFSPSYRPFLTALLKVRSFIYSHNFEETPRITTPTPPIFFKKSSNDTKASSTDGTTLTPVVSPPLTRHQREYLLLVDKCQKALTKLPRCDLLLKFENKSFFEHPSFLQSWSPFEEHWLEEIFSSTNDSAKPPVEGENIHKDHGNGRDTKKVTPVGIDTSTEEVTPIATSDHDISIGTSDDDIEEFTPIDIDSSDETREVNTSDDDAHDAHDADDADDADDVDDAGADDAEDAADDDDIPIDTSHNVTLADNVSPIDTSTPATHSSSLTPVEQSIPASLIKITLDNAHIKPSITNPLMLPLTSPPPPPPPMPYHKLKASTIALYTELINIKFLHEYLLYQIASAPLPLNVTHALQLQTYVVQPSDSVRKVNTDLKMIKKHLEWTSVCLNLLTLYSKCRKAQGKMVRDLPVSSAFIQNIHMRDFVDTASHDSDGPGTDRSRNYFKHKSMTPLVQNSILDVLFHLVTTPFITNIAAKYGIVDAIFSAPSWKSVDNTQSWSRWYNDRVDVNGSPKEIETPAPRVAQPIVMPLPEDDSLQGLSRTNNNRTYTYDPIVRFLDTLLNLNLTRGLDQRSVSNSKSNTLSKELNTLFNELIVSESLFVLSLRTKLTPLVQLPFPYYQKVAILFTIIARALSHQRTKSVPTDRLSLEHHYITQILYDVKVLTYIHNIARHGSLDAPPDGPIGDETVPTSVQNTTATGTEGADDSVEPVVKSKFPQKNRIATEYTTNFIMYTIFSTTFPPALERLFGPIGIINGTNNPLEHPTAASYCSFMYNKSHGVPIEQYKRASTQRNPAPSNTRSSGVLLSVLQLLHNLTTQCFPSKHQFVTWFRKMSSNSRQYPIYRRIEQVIGEPGSMQSQYGHLMGRIANILKSSSLLLHGDHLITAINGGYFHYNGAFSTAILEDDTLVPDPKDQSIVRSTNGAGPLRVGAKNAAAAYANSQSSPDDSENITTANVISSPADQRKKDVSVLPKNAKIMKNSPLLRPHPFNPFDVRYLSNQHRKLVRQRDEEQQVYLQKKKEYDQALAQFNAKKAATGPHVKSTIATDTTHNSPTKKITSTTHTGDNTESGDTDTANTTSTFQMMQPIRPVRCALSSEPDPIVKSHPGLFFQRFELLVASYTFICPPLPPITTQNTHGKGRKPHNKVNNAVQQLPSTSTIITQNPTPIINTSPVLNYTQAGYLCRLRGPVQPLADIAVRGLAKGDEDHLEHQQLPDRLNLLERSINKDTIVQQLLGEPMLNEFEWAMIVSQMFLHSNIFGLFLNVYKTKVQKLQHDEEQLLSLQAKIKALQEGSQLSLGIIRKSTTSTDQKLHEEHKEKMRRKELGHLYSQIRDLQILIRQNTSPISQITLPLLQCFDILGQAYRHLLDVPLFNKPNYGRPKNASNGQVDPSTQSLAALRYDFSIQPQYPTTPPNPQLLFIQSMTQYQPYFIYGFMTAFTPELTLSEWNYVITFFHSILSVIDLVTNREFSLILKACIFRNLEIATLSRCIQAVTRLSQRKYSAVGLPLTHASLLNSIDEIVDGLLNQQPEQLRAITTAATAATVVAHNLEMGAINPKNPPRSHNHHKKNNAPIKVSVLKDHPEPTTIIQFISNCVFIALELHLHFPGWDLD